MLILGNLMVRGGSVSLEWMPSPRRRLSTCSVDAVGDHPAQCDLIMRLLATYDDTPVDGVSIYSTRPIDALADPILEAAKNAI